MGRASTDFSSAMADVEASKPKKQQVNARLIVRRSSAPPIIETIREHITSAAGQTTTA
jgi:hypothetical protein